MFRDVVDVLDVVYFPDYLSPLRVTFRKLSLDDGTLVSKLLDVLDERRLKLKGNLTPAWFYLYKKP